MKVITIALSLAAAVSAAPLGAQVVARASTNQSVRTDCTYNRTTNSVGDIIFGRTSAANCEDVRTRENGVWYQEGRGPNNNSIYVRRVLDPNGIWVIQRARLNADGRTFTVFSTRPARTSDKQWKQVLKEQRKAYKASEKAEDKAMKDRLKSGAISKDQYEAWKRGDKQQDKIDNASMKANEKAQKEAWKDSKGKGKGKK